jgi:hypothetical protein
LGPVAKIVFVRLNVGERGGGGGGEEQDYWDSMDITKRAFIQMDLY